MVKNPPGLRSLGWKDPLEKEMAAYSSILKPGKSMGFKRVGYDITINNNILHLEDVLVQIYVQLKVT